MMNFAPIYHQVELDRLRFNIQQRLSRSSLTHATTNCDVMYDMISGDIVATLTAFIAGRTCNAVDEKYPADWWQAFRERWLPRWWLRRRPSTYTRILVQKHTLFPDVGINGHRSVLVMEMRKGMMSWPTAN